MVAVTDAEVFAARRAMRAERQRWQVVGPSGRLGKYHLRDRQRAAGTPPGETERLMTDGLESAAGFVEFLAVKAALGTLVR